MAIVSINLDIKEQFGDTELWSGRVKTRVKVKKNWSF